MKRFLAGRAENSNAGITSASFNGKGELMLTLTDGTEINLGKAVGVNGKDGMNGKNGIDGIDGSDGKMASEFLQLKLMMRVSCC